MICENCGNEHVEVIVKEVGYSCPKCGRNTIRTAEIHQTNADKIRNMTDEELANMLDEVAVNGIMALDKDYPCDDCAEKINCDICFLEWLQTERSNDGE